MCTVTASPIAAPPAPEEAAVFEEHAPDMWCSSRLKNFHFNPLFDPAVVTLTSNPSEAVCVFDGRSLREEHTLLFAAGSSFPLVIPEDIVVRAVLAVHAGTLRDFVWTDTLCDSYALFTASASPSDSSIVFKSTAFGSLSVPHAVFSAQVTGRFRGTNSCGCPGVDSVVYKPALAQKTPVEILGLLSRGEL